MATYGRPGVYITERLLPAPIPSAGTAEASGAVLGSFTMGPEAVTRVTSFYDFTQKYGGYSIAYPATFGVGQFFANGGSELYVKRVLAVDAASAGVAIPSTTTVGDVAQVIAKNRGIDGNNLRIQVTATATTGLWDLTVYKETVAGTGSDVTNDVVLERYQSINFSDENSSDFAEAVINLQSDYIEVIVANTDGSPATTVLPFTGGDDGTAPGELDYSGALTEFSTVNRPLVVFAPGIMSKLGATAATGVYNALIEWANENNSFVVVETAASLSVSDATTFAGTLTKSANAAVYYPHIYISDPVGRSPQAIRKVGPSGGVAGLVIATDKQYGPFKAPAGVRSNISGAISLERAFTSDELDSLNTANFPVNAIRNLPGAGIVVMGARTLQQDGTANRYVNMRRSLTYIRETLENLTQFAIFENNDEKLWARLRTIISVFLSDYRGAGGLRGATEAEAFFVKVDSENNPATTIELGEVHIEVGVALQYPAEYVVINLSQKTAA